MVRNIFLLACLCMVLWNCERATRNDLSHSVSRLDQDTVRVYKSDRLEILKVSNHVYQHVSFLDSRDFGRVDCNGMIVVNDGEAIILDTPVDHESAAELINFVSKTTGNKIVGIIPTHFHEDCIGGLEVFNKEDILAYASDKTIFQLKESGHPLSDSFHSFTDSLDFLVGTNQVLIRFFGKGHTRDNVVAYVPQDSVMFGGCLIKAVAASKGNLADASVAEWSGTVMKLKQYFPGVKKVIPGHGKTGGPELLDYTIKLFE